RAVGRVVGADRRRPARSQPEELAVLIEGELGVDDAAAALLVAEQALGTLGNPAHRTTGHLGCPQRESVFGISTALHPEAAAHIVANHPEFVVRQLEDMLGE